MARPVDVLSELAYKNYRNVRAVALLYIVIGIILLLAGIGSTVQALNGDERMHPAVAIGIAAVGLAGFIGGIATRLGNRQWASVIKVMAWLYIFAFPIGTILSLTLLDGFSQYLKSIDRIRRADERGDDEDWDDEDDDDWDDEEEEDYRPKKRRKPRD